MNEPDPSVSVYPAFRTNAFSVRCLKDIPENLLKKEKITAKTLRRKEFFPSPSGEGSGVSSIVPLRLKKSIEFEACKLRITALLHYCIPAFLHYCIPAFLHYFPIFV